jgi:hypothetical protein
LSVEHDDYAFQAAPSDERGDWALAWARAEAARLDEKSKAAPGASTKVESTVTAPIAEPNGHAAPEPPLPASSADYGATSPSRIASDSVRLKTAAAFCAEYVPLSYAIEPVVRSRSLYTLTAKTGGGKTLFLVAAALALARGRDDLLGMIVEPGRVVYLAYENPDDVRMKLMVAAYLHNIDLRELGDRLIILDQREKPEHVRDRLANVGELGLIVADTLAAWFDGKDVNDNVQTGEFLRRVRPLTNLAGYPSVIIAAHPVKNATEDQLVPYGGGATLNEVDGNLTLWRRPGSMTCPLHWQGKLRGLEFEPKPFRFDLISSPDVVDRKGRQVSLPVLRPTSEADDQARRQEDADLDAGLLRAMAANPTGTQEAWGQAIGKDKSNVCRRLQRLKDKKLVEESLGRWSVSTKGRKALDAAQ